MTALFKSTFFFEKHSYQVRNPVTFLNFIKVISHKPIATLYVMENFRCFPYKIGCKKSKSSLVLLVFDIVLEIIDKNIKKKGNKGNTVF